MGKYSFYNKERMFIKMAFSRKLLICTFVILAIALVAGFLPVHGEEEIYDTVVRLHVVANSDSDEDQALKLKVRDSIIEVVTPAVKECRTQDEAIEAIEAIMPEIEECARETVRQEGSNYEVKVLLGEEYYPTKKYETCAFPEGEYVSLRVLLGEGEGQNWWCCLFPPLCLSAATGSTDESNEDAFISAGLNADQYKIITESDTPKYKVRFKILETLSSWFN